MEGSLPRGGRGPRVVQRVAALAAALVLCLSWGGAGAAAGGEREVRLAFVGDVLLGSRVAELIAGEGADAPWQHVAPLLREADVAVANLECAVGLSGEPQEGKEYVFRAPPTALEGMARAGIDVVGLANNHVLDLGTPCFLEMLDHLGRAGLTPVGGGRNLEEAAHPYIAEVNGIRVGILGVCLLLPPGWAAAPEKPGVFSGFDRARLLGAIRDLDGRVDWTVVYVHWGVERSDFPEQKHRDLARQMLEAGADLVIGHHPHVWQGMDRGERTLVAYSLGNFVFTIRPEVPRQQETGVLLVTLTPDRIREVRVVPCHIPRAGETIPARDETAASILERLDRLSAPFGTWVDGKGRVGRAPFPDVREHWAREYVASLAARGIVKGDETGRFRPEDPVDLAALTALVVRSLSASGAGGRPDPGGAPLPPLPPELQAHWVAPYLARALQEGLVTEGEAAPDRVDDPVPRWRAAAMLRAAAGAAGRPLGAPAAAPSYADLGDVPPAALGDVAAVSAAGLMQGYPDGTFRPAGTLTRAQTAAIIYRLLEHLAGP